MKHSMRIAYLFAFLVMAWSGNAHAQSWTVADTVRNVIFSYQETTCSGSEVLLIRIENTTSGHVNVNFGMFEGEELKYILLEPNQTVTGDCNTPILIAPIPAGRSTANISKTLFVQ